MTTYPDADDARNMKSGSTHDAMEAWRIIAHDLRAENAELRSALKRIDHIVYDVPKTGDPDSAVMDIARVVAEVD